MKSLLLGALLLLTSGQSVNFFSLKQDVEIGSVASKEAEQALPLIRDGNLNRYFRSIGQRITRSPSLPTLQYRFRIVNSKELNSLGFPGGSIYVNRGLIEVAANDAELAAILAHEIGHVAARHGTAQLSRQLLVQAPISIAAGLPTGDAWKDQLTRLGISFGVDAPFLRYSADQEAEANLMAVRLLSEARFDPNGLRSLLEKVNEVQTAEGGRSPVFVFNHPQSENLSSRGNRRADTVDKAAHSEIPADTISPVFVHPQDFYRLSYPQCWLVTRTPPNGGIIAPVDGVQTSLAGNDVTRGAMFDLLDVTGSERPLTLEQATNRLIVYLRQRNQSIQDPNTLRIVPGAQSQTLLSDEPALRTIMIGKSTATQSAEIVWVVTRLYYKSLFYMVFVAPEEEFPTYQPIFEQMIHSVRLR